MKSTFQPRARRRHSAGRTSLALAVLTVLTALIASALMSVSGIFASLIYRFL